MGVCPRCCVSGAKLRLRFLFIIMPARLDPAVLATRTLLKNQLKTLANIYAAPFKPPDLPENGPHDYFVELCLGLGPDFYNIGRWSLTVSRDLLLLYAFCLPFVLAAVYQKRLLHISQHPLYHAHIERRPAQNS